jgi:acyl-CoA reductase-like NAD-dependent aldehyde dehydrogenase
VTLELGGAAILIVLEDADIEHAVKSTLLGKFFHSGQICMSTNNILGNLPHTIPASCSDLGLEYGVVHESVADEFVSVLNRETAHLQASHDSNTPKHIRGLFTSASAKRVNELVADALSKGAKVVVGDADTAGKNTSGNIVQPVVLDRVTTDMGE